MISLEDFQKIEIKIGTIVEAKKVPETDKLVSLRVDVGNELRQVVAGIAQAYPDPEKLVGKQLPLLTNLEPRHLRGLDSQGMILAVSFDGDVALLHPDKPVPPGAVVG